MIYNKNLLLTSTTRQVRQQWFSVGIFPLKQFFGLIGNRPQSATNTTHTVVVHQKDRHEIQYSNHTIFHFFNCIWTGGYQKRT